MDLSKIAAALEQILERTGTPAHNDVPPIGDQSKPDLGKLLVALREIPELGVFDGQLQIVPGQASRVEYETLGSWLLKRAGEVGPSGAVEDLSTFARAEEIPVKHISAVEGLKLSRSCTVDQALHLIFWEEVSETASKKYVRDLWEHQARFPTAALVHEYSVRKEYLFSADTASNPIFNLRFEDQEVMLCAGLFGPVAPVVLASWTEFPAWFPRSGVSYSYVGPTDRSHDRGWPEEAYKEFPRLYEKFRSLHMPEREHLHVPLDRLNKAMRRLFPVDAAIDLGIALEALFLSELDGDRGELGFRLRVRGARYLGHSTSERLRISKQLSSLYTARSVAVHTGVLSEEIDGTRVKSLLEQGYILAAAAVRSMIEKGSPDWNEVIFS